MNMFIRTVLLASLFIPCTSFAIYNCPARLIPPPQLTVGYLEISGGHVAWQGKSIPAFSPGRRYSELALLYFLASHPNQIFSQVEIIRRVFPFRLNDTLKVQTGFVKSVLLRLKESFEKQDPGFRNIASSRLHGWAWVDLNEASPLVLEVGDVRVTANEVFWKGLPVPNFGSAAQEKRRFLIALLEHIDQFVSFEELATEIMLDTHPLSAPQRKEQILSLLRQMHADFQSVDPLFGALKTNPRMGVAWSASGKIEDTLPLRVPAPGLGHRYRFRGKELSLTESTRALLEALLEQAPLIVPKSKLWAALLKGRPSVQKSLLRVRMLHLRQEVGAGTILPVRGVGYVWIALDRPEIIESETDVS